MVDEFYLENGLRIIVLNNVKTKYLLSGFVVHSGSREDSVSKQGLAHLAEHIFFELISSSNDNKKFLEKKIKNLDFYTNGDNTVFSFKHEKKYLEDVINFYLKSLKIDKALISKERLQGEKIDIFNEINFYNSNKEISDNISDILVNSFYNKTTISNNILGKKETLKNISINDLENLYRKKYIFKNTSFFLIGDFKKRDIVKTFTKNNLNIIKKDKKNRKLIKKKNSSVDFKPKVINEEKGKDFSNILIHFNIERGKADLKKILVLDMINFYLSGRENNLLYEKLKKDKKLVYHIDSEVTKNYDYIEINIQYSTQREKVKKSLNEIEEVLIFLEKKFSEKGFCESLKKEIKKIVLSKEDNVFEVFERYEDSILNHYPLPNKKEYLKELRGLKNTDIIKFIKKNINFKKAGIVIL